MIINSPYITGSITISGFLTGSFTGSFSGSLFGTASQATSASLAATSSVAYSGTGSFSGSFTGSLSGSFSGSLFGTASYATFALNAGGASGFPFTGSASITGSFRVSGSTNISASSYAMAMLGSGSNVFTVDGTSGRLFQVDDSLSGSLFSVNTAAGLPIIEAFSDNTVRIGQFGQKVLFVSQSKVGVGTETPVTNLDVSGSVRVTNGLSETGSVNISGSITMTGSFTTSGTITAQTLVVQTITSSIEYSSGSNIFGSLLTNTQTFTGSVNITGSQNIFGNVGTNYAAQSNIRSFIYDNSSTNYAFVAQQDGAGTIAQFSGNGGSSKMYISSSGNVGIGLTNPSAVLYVSGSGSGSLMQISSHVSSSIFYVSGSGNIGIGTTTPGARLEIWQSTQNRLLINYANIVNEPQISSLDSSNNPQYLTINSYDLKFKANGTEAMRITSAGNVGIGTTSPQQQLHVSNASNYVGALINGSNAPQICFAQGSGTSPNWKVGISGNDGNAFSISSGSINADKLVILRNGNVGIGTFAPAYTLDVSGTAAVLNVLKINASATTSVSTSATIISTVANTYGGMAIVWGNSSGNIFTDLVFYSLSTTYVINGQSISGSPVGRTYTSVSGDLKLAMASGTYTIYFQAILTS